MSKRSAGPFVAVDCGLLSKELASSTLFGHEKGAFTGAESKKQGFWEEAAGGTLFLDEIGNLPPEVQQMLLRALEAKRYRPTGGSKDKQADVRIIAATNEELDRQVKGFDAEARKRLLAYAWGGNVRELKRVVRMAVLHTEGDTVTADTLEFDEMPIAADASLALDNMEKKQIIHALEQAKGNRKLAAALLGIGRNH